MDDLPTSIPELHARLKKAREVYRRQEAEARRLAGLVAHERERAAAAGATSDQALRVLNSEFPEAGPLADHPLVRAAVDSFDCCAASATNRMRAGHRLGLIRRAVLLWGRPADDGEVARLLGELRAELADEDARHVPQEPDSGRA